MHREVCRSVAPKMAMINEYWRVMRKMVVELKSGRENSQVRPSFPASENEAVIWADR